MESPACASDFFNAKFDLVPGYDNAGMSLECDHIHIPKQSLSCAVCSSLLSINRDDMVSAGARAQRPVRSSSQRRSSRRSRSSSSRSSSARPSSARPSSRQSGSAAQSSSDSVLMPVDRMTSMHDWQMKIRKEGEMIADYLRSTRRDHKNMTIQELMSVMAKVGIQNRDRSELFDLLNSVRAAMTDSGLSVSQTHPLVIIYGRNSTRVNKQMKEIDDLQSMSSYQNLLSATQFQSVHFKDMSSSGDLLFSFKSPDSVGFVHPIAMALFGVKLPAIESAFVNGDSLSLLAQLHHNSRVRPNNYQLLVNKLTEETPIVMPGVGDSVSMEIQRAVLHTNLRRCILNLRMGVFYCESDESIDNALMKIIHPSCASIMTDEEQILASIFSIVSFKPTLVSVSRPSFGTGIGGMGDMAMHTVPYLVVDSSKMITTSTAPIHVGGEQPFSCTAEAGRVLYMPAQNMGAVSRTDVASAVCAASGYLYERDRAPVITNGVLVFLVNRRGGMASTGDCFTNMRPVISDIPIEVSQDMMLNGIMYRLVSAVCYRVGDGIDNCSSADAFANGYCTILFTDAGPWLYDPMTVLSRSAREARLMRAMRNTFAQESGGSDGQCLNEWLRGDGAAAMAAKQSQHMQHKAMFEDDLLTMEEAMLMISRYCTILIYGQEYDPYMSSRNMCDVLC